MSKIILKGRNNYQLRELNNKLFIVKFDTKLPQEILKTFNLNDRTKATEIFNKNFL